MIQCRTVTRWYAKRFEKVLPPTEVIRFAQIADKLDRLLQLKVVANIPLAVAVNGNGDEKSTDCGRQRTRSLLSMISKAVWL
jgi:hypothetical protein